MAKKEARTQSAVYKLIEIVGTSTESWADAAKNGVNAASKSLRDLRVAEVEHARREDRGQQAHLSRQAQGELQVPRGQTEEVLHPPRHRRLRGRGAGSRSAPASCIDAQPGELALGELARGRDAACRERRLPVAQPSSTSHAWR